MRDGQASPPVANEDQLLGGTTTTVVPAGAETPLVPAVPR
jgi:hypothetical protein